MTAPLPSHPGLTDDSGAPITLGRGLIVSGEAKLFERDGHPEHVIKLHHSPDRALQRKLDALPALAPPDPSLLPGHVSYAWPISAVRNMHGDAVGCVIPKVADALTLTSIANPKLRRRRAPWVDFETLHAIAASTAFAVAQLHAAGIVIGDIRPENIVVAQTGLPTLIDCDSYQVRDGANRLHPCRVGSEGFTAPEWIGRAFDSGPRAEASDRFGLAVLLHQLLTGNHPWTGAWQGAGDPPTRDRLIRDGEWPFRPGSKLLPVPGMVTPDELAPELAVLFRQAFIAGASDPEARPSAEDWYAAASAALSELDACAVDASHRYDSRLDTCPWCAREAAGLPTPQSPSAQSEDPWQPAILAVKRALARGDRDHAFDMLQAAPSLLQHEAMAALSGLLEIDQVSPALLAQEDVSVDPALMPLTDVDIDIPPLPGAPNALSLRYEIDFGWGGLRRPTLQVSVVSLTDLGKRLPALDLVHLPTGDRVAHVPTARVKRQTTVSFEMPERPGRLELRATNRQQAEALNIVHPSIASRSFEVTPAVPLYASKVAVPPMSYFALANKGARADS